jgi:hypothetical protein
MMESLRSVFLYEIERQDTLNRHLTFDNRHSRAFVNRQLQRADLLPHEHRVGYGKADNRDGDQRNDYE